MAGVDVRECWFEWGLRMGLNTQRLFAQDTMLPDGTLSFAPQIFDESSGGLVVEIWPSEAEDGVAMGERWLREAKDYFPCVGDNASIEHTTCSMGGHRGSSSGYRY